MLAPVDDPFAVFIDAANRIVRSGQPAQAIVSAIEPCLRELVNRKGWLDAPYRQPILTKSYAQYLLHRPADHAFSIVSFVWNPGQGSPLHDHGTWGVIGQYEGEEEEQRFRRGERGMECIVTVIARPGDVSHVYPPDRDIHRITNRTFTPTVSIHIYGGDIGSHARRVFDPHTGTASAFVSGYDPVSS